ncbi:hypothetical protein GCM10008932_08500 [Alkalibacterium iburiense]|uniref:Aminoglycoside phosphotransferase domain-containing protein n=2 Tax=Alkalibacterium iburiense TaxID=290589 RepID=A0ABN0X8R1_9LACT
MHILETDTREVVLREYTNQEWLQEDPTVVAREAENLKAAEMIEIPTPKYLAVDATGREAGRPSVLMSKVEGKVELKNLNLEKLAQVLIAVHSLKDPPITHRFFSYNTDTVKPEAKWSAYPEKWQDLFAYLKEHTPPNYEPTFIHRDFHPTNVLWTNGDLSAIVDWPNACIGPREFDIAHCRWNLAMMTGQEAADGFLEAYIKQSDVKMYDTYWDLLALSNVFDEDPPAVYEGWTYYGLTELTPDLMRQRMDAFLIKASRHL